MYSLLVSKCNIYKDCLDIFGVWIDTADKIKFNKQVSTSVKQMQVWCNTKLGIQEREKRPHKKYQLGTRDCGRSKIAWKEPFGGSSPPPSPPPSPIVLPSLSF